MPVPAVTSRKRIVSDVSGPGPIGDRLDPAEVTTMSRFSASEAGAATGAVGLVTDARRQPTRDSTTRRMGRKPARAWDRSRRRSSVISLTLARDTTADTGDPKSSQT